MVISCDNSKSFLLNSVIPYVHQPTTVLKTPSEVVQSPVPPSAHLISGSLTTLSHSSFSVATTNATTGMLSHVSYHNHTSDDSLCKNRVKEAHYDGPCCENATRRLRLKTTDGPSPGLRSTYGQSVWHDGLRQPMLSYSGHGASRCYTKPSPSLPLLPLGQAYGRGTSRRFVLSSFPESHW